jgi:hypothetical protein
VNLVDVQRPLGNLDPLSALGDEVKIPYRERRKVAISYNWLLENWNVQLLFLHSFCFLSVEGFWIKNN